MMKGSREGEGRRGCIPGCACASWCSPYALDRILLPSLNPIPLPLVPERESRESSLVWWSISMRKDRDERNLIDETRHQVTRDV